MQFGPVLALVSGQTVANAINDSKNDLTKLETNEKDDSKLINALFLRILNRAATSAEVDECLRMMHSMPQEHQTLAARLKAYEASIQPRVAAAEKKRQAGIVTAKAALTAYEKQIAAREAELDRKHQAALAKAEAALKGYQTTLPQQLAKWEAREDKFTQWTTLDPAGLSSTSATTLTKQKDLSIRATSSNGLGAYQVVANTNLTGITAIRLEALKDDKQPKKGPGRSTDGNFVLTEFALTAAPKADPKKTQKIKLANPQADFSQKRFSVASAIDGKILPNLNGWAVAPKTGVNHVATFDTAKPLGFKDGTILTFKLHQQFQSGVHSLGLFRLSVSTSTSPTLVTGAPKEIATALAVPAAQRKDAQKAALMKYFKGIDNVLKRLQLAAANAKKPRPVKSLGRQPSRRRRGPSDTPRERTGRARCIDGHACVAVSGRLPPEQPRALPVDAHFKQLLGG